jgi:hypothetical protein
VKPWRAAVFAGVAAALLLFQIGYHFEAGDQLQYLLLPYRELFPDFLPGDWFTWHTSHYHETFAWVVRAIYALSGETGFAHGMFAVHVLNLAAVGYALFRLAQALGFGSFEASFCLLIFALVRQVALGGAVLNHAGLVPADLALAPFLLASAAYAEGQLVALGIYLGISGFLHANYALLGALALFPLAALQCLESKQWLRLSIASALFALIASPTLWLIATSFLASDHAPSAVALTLFVRSPHHYDLSAMRLDQFYCAWVLALAAWPAPAGADASAPATRRAYRGLVASFALWIALGLLGAGLHIVPLARLFTFRMSIPLFALWQLRAGHAIREFARRRDALRLTWALGISASLACFAQTDPLEPSRWTELPRLAVCGCLLLTVATACVLWPLRAESAAATQSHDSTAAPRAWRRHYPWFVWTGAVATVLCCLAGLRAIYTSQGLGRDAHAVAARSWHLLDAPIALTTPTRKLYADIRAMTPAHARFLVPPGHSQFRLQARRAIFVDWKCAPMKGDEALEWQRRMLLAMGMREFPVRGYELPRAANQAYEAQPLAALGSLARREGLTHVLTRRHERTPPAGLRRVLESGGYVVYELTDASP